MGLYVPRRVLCLSAGCQMPHASAICYTAHAPSAAPAMLAFDLAHSRYSCDYICAQSLPALAATPVTPTNGTKALPAKFPTFPIRPSANHTITSGQAAQRNQSLLQEPIRRGQTCLCRPLNAAHLLHALDTVASQCRPRWSDLSILQHPRTPPARALMHRPQPDRPDHHHQRQHYHHHRERVRACRATLRPLPACDPGPRPCYKDRLWRNLDRLDLDPTLTFLDPTLTLFMSAFCGCCMIGTTTPLLPAQESRCRE